MDVRAEASEFLHTRRERLTPEMAGLPAYGERRRVKGLRREEVALLAGVSVEYYVRLERGNLAGVSESVLDAVATALQLDDVERSHLHTLARLAGQGTAPRTTTKRSVRPQVRWLLDTMQVPAYVRNQRFDLLAASPLGRAVFAPLFDMAGGPNMARFVFLDPRAPEFFPEWERVAGESAGTLRTMATENPYDQGLTQLVGELCTRSRAFTEFWAAHVIREHRSGTKLVDHPVVGELVLRYESMQLVTDPTLRLNAYTAEPGSPSAERLQLLASWSTTTEEATR